ncbi:MAG: type IV secretion system DNA-binding domain-containing protein [Novosphingobium sp.]
MKRNLADFTRGSQLLGHFSFMFAAGLKGPVILTGIAFSWLTWWEITGTLNDHQVYLLWMRLYAALYGFMEFDPAKHVSLETGLGGTFQIAISRVTSFPPVAAAWDLMLGAVEQAGILTLLIMMPLIGAFYWFAVRFGARSKAQKHERGAQLVSRAQLLALILAHNARERARELTERMGIRWRLATARELDAAGFYRPAELAGMPYPWRHEQSHTMLVGTTGTGKTVALLDLLAQVRERGQRAVVFDLTGAYIEAFYDPARDVILNPLDARCPRWSVFDECSTVGEFTSAAAALVPHDGGGQEQFWVLAARTLFVEMCMALVREGQASNEALADRLMRADLASVHVALKGTLADPLTAPEAARMAESIRAVFNVNAQALLYLPKSGTRFSIKDWIKDGHRDGSILFVSARYIDLAICAQLLTLWLDTAMNTLMTLGRTRDPRIWFLFDELGALHRLPALEKGLQTARNFGGAIIAGIHAFAKLKEVYGENIAVTLSSLARTKLVLAASDDETANWCSDSIGRGEIREMEESYSYGYNSARDAVSLNSNKRNEHLVVPDDIKDLEPLAGYIKFPGGFPAARVKMAFRHWPRRAEGFIPRGDDGRPGAGPIGPDGGSYSLRPGPDSAAANASESSEGGDGRSRAAGPRSAPRDERQPSLPLAAPPPRAPDPGMLPDANVGHMTGEPGRDEAGSIAHSSIADTSKAGPGEPPTGSKPVGKASPTGNPNAAKLAGPKRSKSAARQQRDLLEGGVPEQRDEPDSTFGIESL